MVVLANGYTEFGATDVFDDDGVELCDRIEAGLLRGVTEENPALLLGGVNHLVQQDNRPVEGCPAPRSVVQPYVRAGPSTLSPDRKSTRLNSSHRCSSYA